MLPMLIKDYLGKVDGCDDISIYSIFNWICMCKCMIYVYISIFNWI